MQGPPATGWPGGFLGPDMPLARQTIRLVRSIGASYKVRRETVSCSPRSRDAVMFRALKRFFLFGVVPLLVIGGFVAWVERDTLRSWFYLHRLEGARGASVGHWARKTASLDSPIVPRLLSLLAGTDE